MLRNPIIDDIHTYYVLINNIIVDYCYSGGGETTLCLMSHAMTVLSEDKTIFLFNLITFTYQLLENPVYYKTLILALYILVFIQLSIV